MRPEFRPGRPRGLRPVAKRVPTVQGRAKWGRVSTVSGPSAKATVRQRGVGLEICARELRCARRGDDIATRRAATGRASPKKWLV